MRPTHLVAIAIATYLLFLVTRFPAQFAYVFLQDRLPGLTLGELDGTVWQGTARSVVYNGIYAGSLDWNTRPLRMLLGELNSAIRLQGPIDSNADIGYSLTDILTIRNATVKARLADFGQFLPQLSIIAMEGDLSARIESLELQEENLLDIRGSVAIDNLFAGGLVYLGTLANETPSAANIRSYADIVREHSVVRQLISVGTEIADSGYRPEGRTSIELLDEAERKVFEIAEQKTRGGGGFQPTKHLVTLALERIEALYQSDEPITGLSTGFSDFDQMTSGLQPADLIIIAGRPSMGKTTFAMNVAENAAIKTRKPVAVFSMEMPGDSLAMRMLSSLGRVDQHRVSGVHGLHPAVARHTGHGHTGLHRYLLPSSPRTALACSGVAAGRNASAASRAATSGSGWLTILCLMARSSMRA